MAEVSPKEQVLQILLEKKETFVSGQELCERLGVSRTSVWKYINALRTEDHYEIEAVTNKGYRLLPGKDQDILNRQEIENALHTRWAGRPLIYSEKTGSTNDDIMELSDQGYGQGTLCVTDCQTKGKGRRGRTWISPTGCNVYMSILLKPKMLPEHAPTVTLVMALAMEQAFAELDAPENVRFGIKWPNDVVVTLDNEHYKKCVGILTEMRLEDREIKDVTIGIGININQESFPEEISESATSLKLALGRTVNRADLVARVWKYFEDDYEAFEKTEDLSLLQEKYEKALVNTGRKVRVLDPKGEYTGVARGITARGELIVLPDGSEQEVHVANGEISVRGVMGYV